MTRRKFAAPLVLCAIIGATAGCSASAEPESTHMDSSNSSPQTNSAQRTLTEPKLQPPSQPGKYTEDWRPDVGFDPCTQISDEAATRAGLDPSTRKRGKDFLAEYTFLTCDFESEFYELGMESGNATWEEDQQKNGPDGEPFTVNGREAMWVRSPELPENCSIHLRTNAGFVMLTTSRKFEGSEAGVQSCDGVLKMTEAIEPEIGPEN